MLDKLTRYIRGFGPPAASRPDSPEAANADARQAGAAAPGWPRNGAAGPGGPQDGWAVRDLMVEGAVSPALREVFAQERSRSGSGQVITLYDPQRAFAPVLPRLVEALRGAAGDRIRLIDSRSRKALAVIDRALLGAGGNVLRLLEVDISGVERPSPEVPLTLLEQSDVGVLLLGPQPDPALLESLLVASLTPNWRCSSLLLVVPHDAAHARTRLARYTWPSGTRIEALTDPATELPGLWTAELRRVQAVPAAEAASHTERIGEMLAAVAVPAVGRAAAGGMLSEVTVPHEPALHRAVDEAELAAATVAPRAAEVLAPAAALAAPGHASAPATTPRPAPPAATETVLAGVPPAAQQAAPAIVRAASAAPRLLAPLAREPAIDLPAMSAPPSRPDGNRSPAATPARGARPVADAAAAPPQRAATAADPAQQVLEPLMRLPGAIAAATLELREARLGSQIGAGAALTAAQPVVLLSCKPLAAAPAAERGAPVDEWIWTAGGRVHVLQPLPRDPLSAVLVIVDADRADLPMTRWACTVARNGIDQQAATGAAHAARADTAQGASSVR